VSSVSDFTCCVRALCTAGCTAGEVFWSNPAGVPLGIMRDVVGSYIQYSGSGSGVGSVLAARGKGHQLPDLDGTREGGVLLPMACAACTMEPAACAMAHLGVVVWGPAWMKGFCEALFLQSFRIDFLGLRGPKQLL
jgi:hypothetical protein